MSKREAPFKLMLVATELGMGGAERCLTRLALGLDPRLFTPTVVSILPRPTVERAELARSLEDAGIALRFLDCAHWSMGPIAYQRLSACFRGERPDLVQTFLYHANVLGAACARAAGIPRLVSSVRSAESAAWRNRVESLALSAATRVVCVSDSVEQFAQQRLRVSAEKTVVIPNGIEAERYANVPPADLAEWGLPPHEPLLLCVGRLHRQKGFDRLLQNADSLLRLLPHHHLAIAGQGEQYRALNRLRQKSAFSERVHLLGWRADVAALLRRAALLLLPSRWEGMPNVVLEAMAAERPVVAMDVEGVEQLLTRGEPAQIVARDDISSFINSACEVASNPAWAEQLGRRNRQRVVAHFGSQHMLDQFQALHLSLLEPSRAAGE